MDDERLKNPPVGSSVLERIRDIRASMRRVYLQVICPHCWLSANCIAIKVKMLFYTPQNTLFSYDDSIPLTAGEKNWPINFTNNQTAIKINFFI